LAETSKTDKKNQHRRAPHRHWWIRLFHYAKRKCIERKAKKQIENPTNRLANRTALATVWIAGFTTVLAWVGIAQWTQMAEQTRISREAIEAVQRAFVYIDGFQIAPVTVGTNPKEFAELQFFGQIRNTGTTEAVSSRYHINFLVNDVQLPENFPYPDRDEKGNVVIDDKGEPGFFAPQSSLLTSPVHIGMNKVHEAQAGKFLFIYGWIRYRDVFEKTPDHRTLFCDQIQFDAAAISPGSPIHAPRYIPCPKHNCTDEQCQAN
jgi:hypothetical protein